MSAEELLEPPEELEGDELESIEVDSEETINFPEESIGELVEGYWQKESNQNILGNNSYDVKLQDWAEFIYGATSIGAALTNPVLGITMCAGYAVYKTNNFRQNHKKRKRIEEIENKIDERYFFDSSTDLTPIIQNTEEFFGIGGREKFSEIYRFVLDKAEEVPAEADVDGYFKDTSQVLWLNQRDSECFDYSIEMLYDGIPLFEINGYAEADISGLLEESDNPSKSSLIFEYTDASHIGSEDAIEQVKDIKDKLTSIR